MKGNLLIASLLTLSFAVTGCGAKRSESALGGAAPSIINGVPVEAVDPLAASTVSLYVQTTAAGDVEVLCTGSIIGDKTILSAGHCFADVAQEVGIKIEDLIPYIRVGFGVEVVKNLSDARVQFAELESVTVHPDYKIGGYMDAFDGTAFYDMSVLRLKNSIPAGARIVPLLRDAPSLAKDAALTLVGFGLTATTPNPINATHMNKVGVKIDNAAINPVQFTYLTIDGHSACNGDSGGPAYYVDAQGTTYLAGVTSWGDRECSQIGAYTSVPAMVSWVDTLL